MTLCQTQTSKKYPETLNFFKTVSGAKKRIIKQKHRQNNTKKHPTNTRHTKTKVRSRKFFQTTTLRREERKKKRQKTPNQTQKTQSEKNGQHFPLRDGADQGSNCVTVRSAKPKQHLCNSTACSPTSSSGPCFRGLREEVGGAQAALDGESGTPLRAHIPQKTMMMIIIGGAVL